MVTASEVTRSAAAEIVEPPRTLHVPARDSQHSSGPFGGFLATLLMFMTNLRVFKLLTIRGGPIYGYSSACYWPRFGGNRIRTWPNP